MAAELSPLEAFQRYAALGPDFLTWFLVHVLEDDLPALASEPGLKADIQGPLLFASEGGEARKVTLAGDEAASAPEVLAALREGKKLMRARVLLNAMEDQYAFTLDAETFDLRSIKLPVPSLADLNAYFDMRMEALARLFMYVDEYFEGFLQLRLDPEMWKAEAALWKKVATGKMKK
jgi:hypothetical protein